ncbi:MAG: nucleotide exchange factor GrpE [Candidatus Omnitrophica bacterium]|nr:nucleotide exchange factor GrpE [Candidatus Omnitrophota bacterium]
MSDEKESFNAEESEEKAPDAGAGEPVQNAESVQSVTLTGKEFEELQKSVSEAEALRDKLLRTVADYENAKKRLARERDDYVRIKQENLIMGLLPVIDNLERAVAHADSDSKGIVTGVQMVLKQFMESLKSHGVEKLETVGKDFDPHLHEAIAYVKEEGRDHEIIDEIEAGYKLGDRLLRAAKVRVRIHDQAEKSDNAEEA